MCGIYGINRRENKDLVYQKLEKIKFRGPDFTGVKQFENGVTLGHNRLAIIDLDPRSNQPMEYESVSMTFNGEIYNFKSIRAELKLRGYTFNTESDTEVVCAAYLEYGKACVEKFNGMFAFVINDKRKNILFGAVDRLGQKPLYYLNVDNKFEFSSQISTIISGNELNISEAATAEYLLRGYVPAPLSIYKEISKLKAGHSFEYNLNTGELAIENYWDLKEFEPRNIKYAEAKEELKILLEDATAARMISDVPVGSFLSGGVDSSLVTAMAQAQSTSPIKTFCIKFAQSKYDESEYAAQIANHLGTSHSTIFCDPSEGVSLVENMSKFFDEPFADSSAIPSMLISKHTKKYVTVALTGDAGDESFLGYKRYDWINQLSFLYSLPSGIRKVVATILSKLPNNKARIIAQKLTRDKDLNSFISGFLGTMYPDIVDYGTHFDGYNQYLNLSDNKIQKAADLDIKLWLQNDGLTKVDRASMSYSLECRSPFLDYRVVEFARTLPVNFRYDGNEKKKILKDILYDYVPKSMIDRPKQGFAVPIKSWLNNELSEQVKDLLNKDGLNSIPGLNVDFALKMIKLHGQGKVDFAANIWSLLMYKNWEKSIKESATIQYA